MKFNDKGPEVIEMQQWLEAEDYDLPKYGVDGHYGDETQSALNDFEKDRGLPLTIKGDHVHQASLDAMGWDSPEDPEVPAPPPQTITELKVYDLRDTPWITGDDFTQRTTKKFKRGRDGKPVVRDPSQVNGITIHQTAVPYGVKPYQINAAGKSLGYNMKNPSDEEKEEAERLALARRSLQVACHVMAFRQGFVSIPNDMLWYVYHGNGWNSTELGIEIDGRFPGVEGGKTWNGGPATEVTDTLVRAACLGIEILVIEGRKAGMPIEYIHAHRQSSSTRRDDPGEELWKRVVLDFAVPILGLKTEPARAIGDGRPVPKEWDPDGVGKW
jgi:peptidoglycan hydrolase-like protein with peptidoglycan-binding domain